MTRADVTAAKRFRRSWWARLKRLGLPMMARLHVLGDGASWIRKAAGRALTGCRQTLDVYHASQHIATAGKRLFGEGTAEATAFHEHGRELLLIEGWTMAALVCCRQTAHWELFWSRAA